MISEGIIAAIAAGAGAILTGLGALIVNVIKAKKEKTGDKELEYGHTETLVKLVSGQTQELLEVKNLISNMREDLTEKIDAVDGKLSGFVEEQKGFNIAMLRHSILDVWATYREIREMPLDVYNSTLSLYDRYKELGGNSFVSEVVEEMRSYKKY